MTIIRKLPYLIPSSENIIVGPWQVIRDGNLYPLETSMPNWDPAVPLQASINVDINGKRILEDCGLTPDAEISIAAIWSCEGTMLRGVDQNKNFL